MVNFALIFKRICEIMVRKAAKKDIRRIMELLHRVK